MVFILTVGSSWKGNEEIVASEEVLIILPASEYIHCSEWGFLRQTKSARGLSAAVTELFNAFLVVSDFEIFSSKSFAF